MRSHPLHFAPFFFFRLWLRFFLRAVWAGSGALGAPDVMAGAAGAALAAAGACGSPHEDNQKLPPSTPSTTVTFKHMLALTYFWLLY